MYNLMYYKGNSNLIFNTINNPKRSGNIRKTRWIYKRALKGFFYGIDKGDKVKAMAFANQIDSMITVLNGLYKENWDFDIRPKYYRSTDIIESLKGFSLFVVIHYPEIKISNSEGRTHDIKDLFVRFEIVESVLAPEGNAPLWTIGKIKGARSTLSYEEWFVGYLHSHLPQKNNNTYFDAFTLKNFCLGSDTEIVTQQESLYLEYTSESFELFLLTLDSFVAWESLEGVPHKKIEKILIGNRITDTRSNSGSYFTNYLEVERNIFDLDIDFVFSENRYKIKQNSKFERFLHKIIVDHLSIAYSYLLVTKRPNDEKYYMYSMPRIIPPKELREKFKKDGESPYFYFRDKRIDFKVESFTGDLPDINDFKVHPKFIDYVATKLEQELYLKSIRKSSIERYYQSSNA